MLKKIGKIINDFKIPSVVPILLAALGGLWVFKGLVPPSFYSSILYKALDVLFMFTPVWLPVLLAYLFWMYWITYVKRKFLSEQKYTLLEIRLPREIERTPQAMESVFSGLNIKPGETTFINRYWEGKVRPWFSVELVSVEGNIRFFIRTRSGFKNLVESQIYAQYPQVEIYEVSDYTQNVDSKLNDVKLWGSNFVLTQPDPYPIKTYVDYGLDRDQEEEQKVDPLASVLEFMGSIGKGEQIWIQILFQAYKKERHKSKDWKAEAREEIDKILHRKSDSAMPAETSETGFPMQAVLSEGEKKKVEALERSVSKSGFSCGIRAAYLAEPDNFDGAKIPSLIGSFGHFKSEHLNSFKPSDYMAEFDFPWQDFKGRKQKKIQKEFLQAYKKRSYFHPPFKEKSFVLNTEELATLFHFPGSVVQPPTLERIPSKRGEPPSELPT